MLALVIITLVLCVGCGCHALFTGRWGFALLFVPGSVFSVLNLYREVCL